MDTQDSPVVPVPAACVRTSGCRASFNGPDIAVHGETARLRHVADAAVGRGNRFWSVGPGNRLFVYGGARNLVRRRRRCRPSSSRWERRSGWAPTTPASSAGPTTTSPPPATCAGSAGCPISWAARSSLGGWLENGDAFDRVVARRLAHQRRRRRGDGHPHRTGHARRLVEFRRTLAHVYRRRASVPLTHRPNDYVLFRHRPMDSGWPASSCVVRVSSVPSTCQWRGRLIAKGPVPGDWPAST